MNTIYLFKGNPKKSSTLTPMTRQTLDQTVAVLNRKQVTDIASGMKKQEIEVRMEAMLTTDPMTIIRLDLFRLEQDISLLILLFKV